MRIVNKLNFVIWVVAGVIGVDSQCLGAHVAVHIVDAQSRVVLVLLQIPLVMVHAHHIASAH